jgi:hypothetical protein
MKLINIILTLLLVTLASSCFKEIDNYDAPNAGITGIVTDNTTNSGIQSEQPNGFQIRLLEIGYTNVIPIDFWGKADGSFKNTQLFADKYKVIPIQGPFLMPDTLVVTLSGLTTVNFTVTPFMTVMASTPQVVSKNVIVNYTLSKPAQISDNITRCLTMASKVPAVSNAINDYNVSHDISGMTYQDIVSTQFSDTLKNLPSGSFYVRVGARTNNGLGKYNYSKVFPVTIP